MIVVVLLIPVSLLLSTSPRICTACAQHKSRVSELVAQEQNRPDSPEGWRTVLTEMQFSVLRQAATEPPGYSEETTGELEFELKKAYKTKYPQAGAYTCVGCEAPLYYAKSKFNSGCGWPAFYAGIPGAIEERPDEDGTRVEIVCASCKGHLGHVFKGEGFSTLTNERHCVNGICLSYDSAGEQPESVAEVPAGLRLGGIPD